MTDTEFYLYTLIAGQVLPALTDTMNRYVHNSTLRFWVSVLTSAAIAILFNYDRLAWATKDQLVLSALLLWFSGQAAYKTYYEGSQLQYKIRKPTIPLLPQQPQL